MSIALMAKKEAKIEVKCTPAFKKEFEKIAEAAGMSLSAYARVAMNEKRDRDKVRQKSGD